MTAAPHPPNTNQKVPRNSATKRFESGTMLLEMTVQRYGWIFSAH